eukprot:763388-Hanusia_phi.AAC.4
MENQYNNSQGNNAPRMITQDQTIGHQSSGQNNGIQGNQGYQAHNSTHSQPGYASGGANATTPGDDNKAPPMTELSQLLKHCKDLELQKTKLQQQLEDQLSHNKKLSEKTRQGMQHILDTILTKWVDAVDTKDEQVKKTFLDGMQRMVQNSAEDNGVWQMMVQASNLYDRQTHELDQLRIENSQLKERVQGTFGSEDARMSGDKRKADQELERPAAISGDIWADFAKSIASDSF